MSHPFPSIDAFLRLIPKWTMWVDPGETCGLAWTENDLGYRTATRGPDDAQDMFIEFCEKSWSDAHRPHLVIEEYRIYPDKIQIHIGKEIPTAECLGGFLTLARLQRATVVKNASQVKQPIQGKLRSDGIRLTGDSVHARDAELHMWYTTFFKQKGK